MKRILVWDLPTRILHWLFAATVMAALGVALLSDDDSRIFQIHMLLGLTAGFIVMLRVVWGLVGTRYARFGSFIFSPTTLIDYVVGVFRRTSERYVGHNPGSAYATYAMLLLSLGLALSGLLMSGCKVLKELHELMAYTMLVAAGAHVVGIVLHTVRHRENIALSMIHGRKDGDASQEIATFHPVVGVILLSLVIGCAALVFNGHDGRTGQLTLFGQTLIRLGESEHDSAREHDDHHDRRRHDRRRHRDGEWDHHDRKHHHKHHDEDND